MAKRKNNSTETTPIEQYKHTDKKRVNNPPVGLVNAHSDNGGVRKKQYAYDPHIDPKLDWCGKTEHTAFDVQTVSLHVHERIDPRRIIEELKKENQNEQDHQQGRLFETDIKPLRQAIEFYKHTENWSNRLVAGDSLLVMNSLLEKEAMAGKVQMIYFDPPYGIKYGSNFQPFVNKRDVKDGKDDDLTAEPEMIKAFRDTWELGIHSYLTYIRDRLLLARDLLHESGSIFVQIGDENVHHVREILDEVFGTENFSAIISVQKTSSAASDHLDCVCDFVLWYVRNRQNYKYRQLFLPKGVDSIIPTRYSRIELSDGSRRSATEDEKKGNIPTNAKLYTLDNMISTRPAGLGDITSFEYKGKKYHPGRGTFKTNEYGLKNLAKANRLECSTNQIGYVRYLDDFPAFLINNNWTDTATGGGMGKIYVVQTTTKVVQRCLLMSTDPGDLVLDITCGSGTTAFVAENWGRRWITCD
ncbi:MAG: site-specific DNA-methyltransferase, partial [Planctomycetaceae bacterium]|nr:site-specific DNA-methyltransferase [Planctomycetaceae bacterium]